jgi:hypothetical protein
MSMFQALTKDSSVCGLPLTVRNLPKAAQRGWMKEKGFYPAPSDCLRPLSQTGSTILDATPAGWVFSISSRTGKLNFQRLSLLELAHRAFVDPPTPQNALPLRELFDQLFYGPSVPPKWHVPTDWFVFFFQNYQLLSSTLAHFSSRGANFGLTKEEWQFFKHGQAALPPNRPKAARRKSPSPKRPAPRPPPPSSVASYRQDMEAALSGRYSSRRLRKPIDKLNL